MMDILANLDWEAIVACVILAVPYILYEFAGGKTSVTFLRTVARVNRIMCEVLETVVKYQKMRLSDVSKKIENIERFDDIIG